MLRSDIAILIVDENSVRAAIIEDGLRDAGHSKVSIVTEMHGLVRQIETLAPDVIIVDLENPNRDQLQHFFEVSRSVRRPIAMFVDRSDTASIEAAVEAGVSAYIVDGLAKQRIKELQAQILRERSQVADNIVVFRDEDYFDQKCQELCQHVQGWVLRFSKFSDSRVCRSTNDVRDEKVVDRFDNAILDGSEVDTYLGDRVKRRDVFMSVVMTMIWEYVFTRYLFGMDREQRQKLKQLEKNLSEVGTKAQVGQWRAMTLTLLAKREGFKTQCDTDTETVSYEILGTLSKFLPPPANLQEQILENLRNVLRLAV
ncbi:MAG: hypothetical protein M1823_006491, partial [Watsoniomyces obsoletus]